MAQRFGSESSPFFIAGPCVVESDDLNIRVGEALAELAVKLGVAVVYKASFDKANRSRLNAPRGPGLEAGLRALEKVRNATGLPILTDVHDPAQVAPAALIADVLQIPAFLCRQTDLLVATGRAGRPVNIKKGQWMAPEEMRGAVEKVRAGGAPEVAVTERGTFFGYGDLVVDMRSFPRLRTACSAPVIFDATHSVPQPGLGPSFAQAIELLKAAEGRDIVAGVGKSGLIARKIAATFTSTGTPASFLHPIDSLHGDLGIVSKRDVAILLSKSGASDELFGLVAQLERFGVPIIALTGNPASPLAQYATVVLDASVTDEACPETLAPTASTTVALALGDALAVTLLEEKGFRRDDFATLHPGGALGRTLLLRVSDVMLTDNLPTLTADRPMRECVMLLAERRGTVVVVDAQGSLVGVVTAGDLTRLMERTDDFLNTPVRDVMTRTPKSTTAEALAGVAVSLLERHGIMALPVLDGQRRVVGIVHLHDLMKAGAV